MSMNSFEDHLRETCPAVFLYQEALGRNPEPSASSKYGKELLKKPQASSPYRGQRPYLGGWPNPKPGVSVDNPALRSTNMGAGAQANEPSLRNPGSLPHQRGWGAASASPRGTLGVGAQISDEPEGSLELQEPEDGMRVGARIPDDEPEGSLELGEPFEDDSLELAEPEGEGMRVGGAMPGPGTWVGGGGQGMRPGRPVDQGYPGHQSRRDFLRGMFGRGQ